MRELMNFVVEAAELLGLGLDILLLGGLADLVWLCVVVSYSDWASSSCDSSFATLFGNSNPQTSKMSMMLPPAPDDLVSFSNIAGCCMSDPIDLNE